MNIANVGARFALLADVDSTESERWSPLVEIACDYVLRHCAVEQPDLDQTKRLEMLAAAYALKLYCLSADEGVTQFAAGDVRVTSSAGRLQKSIRLWNELAEANTDLIQAEGFLFGRVI